MESPLIFNFYFLEEKIHLLKDMLQTLTIVVFITNVKQTLMPCVSCLTFLRIEIYVKPHEGRGEGEVRLGLCTGLTFSRLPTFPNAITSLQVCTSKKKNHANRNIYKCVSRELPQTMQQPSQQSQIFVNNKGSHRWTVLQLAMIFSNCNVKFSKSSTKRFQFLLNKKFQKEEEWIDYRIIE